MLRIEGVNQSLEHLIVLLLIEIFWLLNLSQTQEVQLIWLLIRMEGLVKPIRIKYLRFRLLLLLMSHEVKDAILVNREERPDLWEKSSLIEHEVQMHDCERALDIDTFGDSWLLGRGQTELLFRDLAGLVKKDLLEVIHLTHKLGQNLLGHEDESLNHCAQLCVALVEASEVEFELLYLVRILEYSADYLS